MFGKLTLDAIPYHEPILVITALGVGIVGALVLGLVTYFGKWNYLWTEWLTSVDHKSLGVMYIVVALVMLLRGFADAIMMRTQQALAYDAKPGYLPPHHYDQIFTAHGVIMIFFVAMPLVMVGLMNLVVPLQIGARDVAFPFLNSLSFWMTAVGAMLLMISLGVGEFAQTGWLAYPPLSELQYSPGVGVDYYMWALADLRCRYAADRRQLLRDHHQDARARHDADEDAGVHLDRAVHQRADHGRVPDPDRHAGAARPGPLPRHALLHE